MLGARRAFREGMASRNPRARLVTSPGVGSSAWLGFWLKREEQPILLDEAEFVNSSLRAVFCFCSTMRRHSQHTIVASNQRAPALLRRAYSRSLIAGHMPGIFRLRDFLLRKPLQIPGTRIRDSLAP